ncbi:hypothetical protein F5887DRAFT_923150 [Amanita rubescens]|nr:hypothetical protein F5887DRAFT_923150 [Amanita rubescens]
MWGFLPAVLVNIADGSKYPDVIVGLLTMLEYDQDDGLKPALPSMAVAPFASDGGLWDMSMVGLADVLVLLIDMCQVSLGMNKLGTLVLMDLIEPIGKPSLNCLVDLGGEVPEGTFLCGGPNDMVDFVYFLSGIEARPRYTLWKCKKV